MKEKLIRFMQGRYGEDAFGRFLLGLYIVLVIIDLFIDSDVLKIVNILVGFYMIFRIMSRNYHARYKENQLFLKKTKVFRLIFKVFSLNIKDRHYHYYICPNCRQICRIVRNKKKGIITCPRCSHTFKK